MSNNQLLSRALTDAPVASSANSKAAKSAAESASLSEAAASSTEPGEVGKANPAVSDLKSETTSSLSEIVEAIVEPRISEEGAPKIPDTPTRPPAATTTAGSAAAGNVKKVSATSSLPRPNLNRGRTASEQFDDALAQDLMQEIQPMDKTIIRFFETIGPLTSNKSEVSKGAGMYVEQKDHEDIEESSKKSKIETEVKNTTVNTKPQPMKPRNQRRKVDPSSVSIMREETVAVISSNSDGQAQDFSVGALQEGGSDGVETAFNKRVSVATSSEQDVANEPRKSGSQSKIRNDHKSSMKTAEDFDVTKYLESLAGLKK